MPLPPAWSTMTSVSAAASLLTSPIALPLGSDREPGHHIDASPHHPLDRHLVRFD